MEVDGLFQILIYLAGGLVTISAGGAVVVKLITYFNNLKGVKKSIDDIQPIVEKIPKLLEHDKEQDVIMGNNSKGLQALIRNEIVRLYNEYTKKGEIEIIDLDNLEHMYEGYKNLGGNGAVDKIIVDLRKLPIKSN